MSSFTDDLIVRKIRGKKLWMVESEFTYFVGEENSNDYVTVPRGFLTDFASVPRIFWAILPPDGRYTQSAVTHDYLYNTQEREREDCDKIFLEAMTVLGVARWKRNIMYHAVRKFGWIPWNKKAKKYGLHKKQD